MAHQFDFLAKAKPATLHRLLAKLSIEDAAIVLTRLPDALAFQVIAYFSEAGQLELGPAMVDARWESEARVEETAGRIRVLLAEAKKNAAAGGPAAASSPSAPLSAGDAPVPGASGMSARPGPGTTTADPGGRPPPPRRPLPRPSTVPASRPGGRAAPGKPNPYQTAAAPPSAPMTSEAVPPAKPGLVARAKEMARDVVKSTLSPAADGKRKNASEPPRPWVPRTATASPINGPALPDTPPPLTGDPFKSPLAKAGLLDLIGRAQQTLLPKGTVGEPARSAPSSGVRSVPKPPAGRPGSGAGKGRPEPMEGMMPRRAVAVSKTPRTVGPRSAGGGAAVPERVPEGGGARRLDGKAVLAAILREADAEVRSAVRHDDPALFRQLRERMFYFDDLALTEDNALARVFTAASAGDAALALRFAAPALRDRVMRVVSPGRARALREGAPGRAGVDDIERARKNVLDVALQLQAAGRILIDPRDPDLAG